LQAHFSGGDSSNLRKKRTIDVVYFLFDHDFKPINPILVYKAGDYDNYRDKIVTEDTYKTFGKSYEANNYSWINDKIMINVGDIAESNPAYLVMKIYLTWERMAYDEYAKKTLPTSWFLNCTIVFKL
jgi:hypothetical protein